jgi:hypothetical protein
MGGTGRTQVAATNAHEVVPSVDIPELIGGLRLAHNGHNRFPGPGFGGAAAKAEAPYRGASSVRSSLSRAAMALTEAGSSAQDRPVRVQALKLSTPDPSTARASSSHAA